MTKIVGLTVLLMGVSGVALALPPPAPEIDPVSGVSAVALLSGALLVVRGWRNSRKK